jgi:hypothetical protein
MANNVSINFKVSGSELSSYIDSIKKKSDDLANSTLKSASQQSEQAKEQIKLIDQQITILERKTRIEIQAARSIALERRESALEKNKDFYEGKRESVFSDIKLTEEQKKEKITALTGIEKEREQQIKNDYRDNLTTLREQERQAKIQTQLAKENIDVLKQTARENVRAIVQGDLKLSDVIQKAQTDDERLVAKLTEEGLRDEKKKQDKGQQQGGILGSLLAVDNLNKVISTVGQFTQTQNGFDLIKPTSSLAGRIIGGALGAIAGAFIGGPAGAFTGASLGSSLGGGIGETTGELLQRQSVAKQDFLRAKGRYAAITGSPFDNEAEIPLLENVGINATQFIQSQGEYARRRGYADASGITTRDAIYAEKGYGVDASTSALLIEIQRSTRENNRDLAQLIGGVIERGGKAGIFADGDTTFLNEFLGKFASLQKELSKTQTYVPTGTTFDILNRFNKVGGEFDARDPRSAGNISAIQNALSNPSSDNTKAVAFRILSRQFPNKGIFDLREEIQKGLGSPGYLKGVLSFVDKQLGGGEQDKLNNLSGFFPGLSLSAVRRLYNNRQNLINGNISINDLKSQFPLDFQGKAEINTPDIDKNQAKIQNGLLQDLYSTIDEMADAFKTAIENTLSGAVIQLNDNRGTITLLGKSTITKQNATKKAQIASRTDANTTQLITPEDIRRDIQSGH